ncbi:hypothetical protein [Mesorhizobium waimense]|uniref:hypothetical protein n=1 Tax=Mesorhizobium waimense TaxID=1300307 RepID=UPI001ABFDCD0|nr:hypothetical protein [Mesorhizobium waimense]
MFGSKGVVERFLPLPSNFSKKVPVSVDVLEAIGDHLADRFRTVHCNHVRASTLADRCDEVASARKSTARRNYAEIDSGLELIALAKKLHCYPVKGRQRTLADVAQALGESGHLSSAGTLYTPTAVSRMLASREVSARGHKGRGQIVIVDARTNRR